MSSRRKDNHGHRTKGQRKAEMARKRDERAKKAAVRKQQQQQVLQSYLADDENYGRFAQQLSKNGLQLRDIPADGNCLFRALGDQRDGHGRNHLHYRGEVVKYMYDHRKDFEPFVTDDIPFQRYLTMLRKIGTYAGNDAIYAFAKMNHVNIVIHQLDQPLWHVKGTEEHNARELHISYHNGDHYSSVRKIGDFTESPTDIRTRDFKYLPKAPSLEPEKPTQEQLEQQYLQQQQQQQIQQQQVRYRKAKPIERKLIDLDNYKSLPAVFQAGSNSLSGSQPSARNDNAREYFGSNADAMVQQQPQPQPQLQPQTYNTAQKTTSKPAKKTTKATAKTSNPKVGVARIYNDGSHGDQETQPQVNLKPVMYGDGSARIYSSGESNYTVNEGPNDTARIYRDDKAIISSIMQETGCNDSNLVEEIYMSHGRNMQSSVDAVFHLMVEGDHIEDQFEDQSDVQFEDPNLDNQAVEGQFVPGLSQPMVEDIDDSGRIWSVNGTGTRIFGNGEHYPNGNGFQDPQDHHSNLSKGARPKQKQLTARQKKEQKKLEKKKRAQSRKQAGITDRDSYGDNQDHIQNQLGMLQI